MGHGRINFNRKQQRKKIISTVVNSHRDPDDESTNDDRLVRPRDPADQWDYENAHEVHGVRELERMFPRQQGKQEFASRASNESTNDEERNGEG